MKYYHSVFCVSSSGQQFVYKIKPKNQHKSFASSFARSLLPKFQVVFIVHCEISLLLLRSLARGAVVSPPKVISVF
jgi:hypothetical protein